MKLILSCILMTALSLATMAQGVSFSYLIPKNGYLAAPISPFSIRGIGVGQNVGLETGATLYSIPGLAMNGLPFDSKKPLVGSHYAIMVPIQAFAKIPFKAFSIKFLAGGFFWVNLNTRINEGNMDRAFRDFEGWTVANTDFNLKSKLGLGWMAGVEFEVKINRDFSLTSEFQYLLGTAKTELSGSYSGGTNTIETKPIELNNTNILIQGLEISLGAKF